MLNVFYFRLQNVGSSDKLDQTKGNFSSIGSVDHCPRGKKCENSGKIRKPQTKSKLETPHKIKNY